MLAAAAAAAHARGMSGAPAPGRLSSLRFVCRLLFAILLYSFIFSVIETFHFVFYHELFVASTYTYLLVLLFGCHS